MVAVIEGRRLLVLGGNVETFFVLIVPSIAFVSILIAPYFTTTQYTIESDKRGRTPSLVSPGGAAFHQPGDVTFLRTGSEVLSHG